MVHELAVLDELGLEPVAVTEIRVLVPPGVEIQALE